MIRKNSEGVYQSTLLTQRGVHHGYSNRHIGRKKFLEALGMKSEDVVVGEQVHGMRVATVKDKDKGKILAGIDGLISKNSRIALGVTFADCVPILAADPTARVIGSAHAGWKGTLAGIARKLIAEMKTLGAGADNIFVSLGPHIGMCCYNVSEERAIAFQKQFGVNEKIATRIEGKWHLDIGYANYQQLLEIGISKDNIDASPTCTSCQITEFNSCRRDPKDRFGVQLGIIAL